MPRSAGWLPKRLPIAFPFVSRNRDAPLFAGFLSVVREKLAAHHPKPAEDAGPPPWPDDRVGSRRRWLDLPGVERPVERQGQRRDPANDVPHRLGLRL